MDRAVRSPHSAAWSGRLQHEDRGSGLSRSRGGYMRHVSCFASGADCHQPSRSMNGDIDLCMLTLRQTAPPISPVKSPAREQLLPISTEVWIVVRRLM